MGVALVSSRSFGRMVPAAETILTDGGFEIRRIDPEVRPVDEAKMATMVREEDPHVIICGPEPITAHVLGASNRLRMVMMHGVGVDLIDVDTATDLGIVVANAPGTTATAVADLAVGAMLVLLRHVCDADQATKRGSWDRHLGRELGEVTVGLIGAGRIGTEVVRRLQGFGTRIIAYDVIEDSNLIKAYGVDYVSLDQLLAESDIVSLHAPLTEETRKLIGRDALRKMKKTAYLVNTARGGLVDEDALYEHLKENPTAAAALDVFATEPPRGNPLLQLDNVLATPHVASYTLEAAERLDRLCARTVVETFSGRRPPNILNPSVLDRFRP
jgi:D-3-phosphoglycerate dehydrogenase